MSHFTRRLLRGLALAIAIAMASRGPAAAHGQTPAQRTLLRDYRDSLDRSVDTLALQGALNRLRDSVDHRRGNDVAGMRLGFLATRVGQVCHERAALVEADLRFGAEIHDHRDWPMAYTGRALARMEMATVNITIGVAGAVQGFLVGDPGSDAADDMVHTAQLDSTSTDGIDAMVGIAMQGYREPQLHAALLTLRKLARLPVAQQAEVMLARLRIERAVGSLDTAVALGQRLLALRPDDAEVMLEAAHSELRLGRAQAGALWFRGLARADSITALLYRGDMIGVMPDSVTARFDATTGQARADALHRWLELDDPQMLRTSEERLREHYRRLDDARLRYSLPKRAFAVGRVAMAGQLDLDDRGIVMVLHGDPDEQTSFRLMGAPPNESWFYKRPDGDDLVFNFVRPDLIHGYLRVPSLFDIAAYTTSFRATGNADVAGMLARGKAVQTHGASWTAQTVQELLYSRENLSPYYSRILSGSVKDALALQSAERAAGDSSIRHRETWALQYELPLDASVDAIAVGSDGNVPSLQVAFAIPGRGLFARRIGGAFVYPVRLRVSVLQGTTLIKRVDTVRAFSAPAEIASDRYLLGRLPVALPPGDYTVHLAVETDSRGTVIPPQQIHVAALSPARVDISDLALGARSVPLPWRATTGDTLWVNPTQSFSRKEPVQLYFEITGLAVGTSYTGTMAVYRPGDRSALLQIGLDGRIDANPAGVQREIDVSRLGAGSYELELVVKEPSGATAHRRRPFVIRN